MAYSIASQPMEVPQGWLGINLGLVGAEQLLAMIEFIISNEIQTGAMLSQFDIVNGSKQSKMLPAVLRWEMVRNGVQTVIQEILSIQRKGRIGLGSPPQYTAHFAFQEEGFAMLFKLKFT